MSTIEEARLLAAKIKSGSPDAGASADKLLEMIENAIQAQSSLQGKFKTAEEAKKLIAAGAEKENKELTDKYEALQKQNDELSKKNKELENKVAVLEKMNEHIENVIRGRLETFYEYYSNDMGAMETIAKTDVVKQFQNFVDYVVLLSKHDSNVSRMLFNEYYPKADKITAPKGDAEQGANKDAPANDNAQGQSQNSPGDPKNNQKEQDKEPQNPHSQRLKQYQQITQQVRDQFVQNKADEQQAATLQLVKAIDNVCTATDRFKRALNTRDSEIKPKPDKPKKPNKGKAARKIDKVRKSKAAKLKEIAGNFACGVCGCLTETGMQVIAKATNKLQSVVELSRASEDKVEETGLRCKNCGLTLIAPQENPPIFPGRLISCEDLAFIVGLHTSGVTLRTVSDFLFPNVKIGNSTLDKNVADGVQILYLALIDYIVEILIKQAGLHADETPVRVFDKEQQRARNMYLLQASTPSYAEEAAVIIEGPTDRKKDTLLKFVQKFRPKALCTDCYKPYQSVTLYDEDDVTTIKRRQSCLAHLMTKCMQIFDQFGKVFYANFDQCCNEKCRLMLKGEIHPEDTVMALICIARILSKISAVFAFERQVLEAAKEDTGEKSGKKFESALFDLRKQVRNKVARELMDDVDVIMEFLGGHFAQKNKTRYTAKKEVEANIADCVVYYLNNRDDFRAFLDHPVLDVDNSVCEINHITVAKYRDTVRLVRDLSNKDVSMMLSIVLTLCANNITDVAGYLADVAAWYSNNGRLRVDIEARRKWWYSDDHPVGPMKRTNYTDYKELYRIPLPEWLHFDVWPTLSLRQRKKLRCDVSSTLEPYSLDKHTPAEVQKHIDRWVKDFNQGGGANAGTS